MKKRFLGILLSFALMLTMMPVLGLSLTAYAEDVEEYPLWVGGTQVTSANYSGPNWFYNADTNTLRLNGSGFGSGVYRDDPSTYDYGIRTQVSYPDSGMRTYQFNQRSQLSQ